MLELEIQDRWLWVIDERMVAALFDEPAPAEPQPHEVKLEVDPAVNQPDVNLPDVNLDVEPVPEPVPVAMESAHPQPPDELETSWNRAESHFQARLFDRALEDYRALSLKHGDSAVLSYNAAVCLQQLGRYEEARQNFEAALDLNPQFREARVGLSWCLLHLRSAGQALAMFEQQLVEFPGEEHALKGRAQAFQLLSLFTDATEAYREILRAEPSNPDVLANLISASAEQRDIASLREYSEHLLHARPRSRQALAGLVTVDIADDQYPFAVQRGADFLDVEPGSYEGWFNMGLAEQVQNRPVQAEQAYRKAMDVNPRRLEAYVNLGFLLFEKNDLPAAQATFEKALELDPHHVQALWNLGLIHEQQASFEEAERVWARLTSVDPEHPESAFHLGLMRFNQKNWPGSAEAFSKCSAKRRDWLEAWVYLGLAQWGSGKLEDAKLAFEQALLHDPIYVPALQCRTALALSIGDLDVAPELEAQLADLGNTIPEFCYNLGVLQQNANRLEAAAQSFRRAVAKRPTFEEALINLGHSLYTCGRRNQAAEVWRSAVALNPDVAQDYCEIA